MDSSYRNTTQSGRSIPMMVATLLPNRVAFRCCAVCRHSNEVSRRRRCCGSVTFTSAGAMEKQPLSKQCAPDRKPPYDTQARCCSLRSSRSIILERSQRSAGTVDTAFAAACVNDRRDSPNPVQPGQRPQNARTTIMDEGAVFAQETADAWLGAGCTAGSETPSSSSK